MAFLGLPVLPFATVGGASPSSPNDDILRSKVVGCLLSDIQELKSYLDIGTSDTSEDKKILLFAEAATSLIEEFVGRPLAKEARTEFYQGTNTQFLPLRSRPVFTSPTIQVWSDDGGFWGSASGAFASTTALVYGTDFAINLDEPDGTSRSGLLIRLNGFWSRPFARRAGLISPYIDHAQGNLKVTYTAGYTVDTLPAAFRLATNLLVARLKFLMPLGIFAGNEAYEERSIGFQLPQKDKLMELVKPLLDSYRNRKF